MERQDGADLKPKSESTIRRLRHISRIIFRNIKGPSITGPIDCYFTLTLDDAIPFFTSTTLRKTLNPSWPALPESLCKGVLANKTSCRFQLYKFLEPMDAPNSRVEAVIVYEANISMHNLELVHCIKPRVLPRLPENTLLLFLSDGIYSLGEKAKCLRQMSKTVMTPSLGLDAAASEDTIMGTTTVDAILSSCERALKHEADMAAEQQQIVATQSLIAQRIAAESARTQQVRANMQWKERVKKLQYLYDEESRRLNEERQQVHDLRQSMGPRAKLLADCCRSLMAQREEVEEARRRVLYAKKVTLDAIETKYKSRRRKLLNTLAFIYPLTSKTQKSPAGQTEKILTIRQLPLNLNASDDDQVSTALGHVAHLVCMLAKYLEVPLRYRVVYMGSRSSIADDVQSFPPFPLYKTGADINRFKVGLQMLNRNIEHLLNAYVPEWKARPETKTYQFLENLKTLLESLVPALQND